MPVLPTPLPEPLLIACSKAMLKELGLTEKDTKDPRFAAFFGGDLSVLETSEILLLTSFNFQVCKAGPLPMPFLSMVRISTTTVLLAQVVAMATEGEGVACGLTFKGQFLSEKWR